MSKKINVICVDGVPICTVRGKKSTSEVIAKLSGCENSISDGRINKVVEELLHRKEFIDEQKNIHKRSDYGNG